MGEKAQASRRILQWKQQVEQGDLERIYDIGAELSKWGGENQSEAKEWFRKGAEAGVLSCMKAWADSLRDADELEQAEEWLQKAVDVSKTGEEKARSALYLAIFFSNQGESNAAEIWYRRAVAFGGTFESKMLVHFLYKQGRTEEAVAISREEFSRNPGTDSVGLLADTLVSIGEYEEGERWYRWLGSDLREPYGFPTNDGSYRLVAALLGQGKFTEADNELARTEADTEGRTESIVYHGTGTWATAAETAVITSSVLPFVQALATKFGEDGYKAAREMVRRVFRHRHLLPQGSTIAREENSETVLRIPCGVSEEALARLLRLDLTAIRRSLGNSSVEVSWDSEQREWKITATE